jgi:hypothetical protein
MCEKIAMEYSKYGLSLRDQLGVSENGEKQVKKNKSAGINWRETKQKKKIFFK